MALRDIIFDDDPLLRKKSRAVEKFDDKLHTLLDDMLETMIKHDGAGIAASQVGILRRAAIIRTEEEEILELINPEIISSEGEQICSEGCLSVKNRRHNVLRPQKIILKAYDRNGKEYIREFENFNADVACHEVDHLDGILFFDRMAPDDEAKDSTPDKEDL